MREIKLSDVSVNSMENRTGELLGFRKIQPVSNQKGSLGVGLIGGKPEDGRTRECGPTEANLLICRDPDRGRCRHRRPRRGPEGARALDFLARSAEMAWGIWRAFHPVLGMWTEHLQRGQ